MRLTYSFFALSTLALVAMGTGQAEAGSAYRPPPQAASQEGGSGFDPGAFLVNKAVNEFTGRVGPQTMLGGMAFGGVFSATAGVLYNGFMVNLKEDRQMGHGEAHCGIIDGLIPLPISIFGKACLEQYAKHDWCANKELRTFASPEYNDRNVIPAEARDAWYEEDYCGAPPRYEFDIFRREAGMKPRSQMAARTHTQQVAQVQLPQRVRYQPPPRYQPAESRPESPRITSFRHALALAQEQMRAEAQANAEPDDEPDVLPEVQDPRVIRKLAPVPWPGRAAPWNKYAVLR